MLRLDYGDAEDRVCRAIAAVAVAMHDFEEEAFAPQGGDADIIPLPYAESDSDASVLAKKSETFGPRRCFTASTARTPPRSRYCRSGTRAGHPTPAWGQIVRCEPLGLMSLPTWGMDYSPVLVREKERLMRSAKGLSVIAALRQKLYERRNKGFCAVVIQRDFDVRARE